MSRYSREAADWKLKQLKQCAVTIYIPPSSLISAVLFSGSLVKQDGHGATLASSSLLDQRHFHLSSVPLCHSKLRLVGL